MSKQLKELLVWVGLTLLGLALYFLLVARKRLVVVANGNIELDDQELAGAVREGD